jgi:phosphoglycolate phosphatase
MTGKAGVNVLFDLDGTLTDPGEGFVACVSYALSKLECRPYAHDEIRRHVGPPLEETLAHLLEDRAMIPAAVAFYRERYASLGYLENAVYPGIEEALRALRSEEMRLFVATSKPTVYAERIVAHFGLERFFRGVYGSELDGARSNKTELLSHLLARELLRPESTFMVGDRAQDMLAAAANGVHPVGALWGYGSREELAQAGATAFCEQARDLPPFLMGLISRRASTAG